MNPVKTDRSNFVFRGPTLDIGDIWTEVDAATGTVYVDWQPTEAEREAIARGKGVIRLGILAIEAEAAVPVSEGLPVVSAQDLAILREALAIGHISWDGDGWYAKDAGYEYDAAERTLNEASAILQALASRLTEQKP